MLYSAHGDGGEATAYRIDPASGRLAVVNKQATNRKNGVSLAVDATNRYLKGLDADFVVRLDTATGKLAAAETSLVASRPGRGRGTASPLPPSFTGNSTTSEIAVSPFVYGSNRGRDSLAIFAIDEASGVLSPVGWEPTPGKTPRIFAIEPSGTFLYPANQTSDTIVTFRVDQATGKLRRPGRR
jgi:6-phosphogluconolactonase